MAEAVLLPCKVLPENKDVATLLHFYTRLRRALRLFIQDEFVLVLNSVEDSIEDDIEDSFEDSIEDSSSKYFTIIFVEVVIVFGNTHCERAVNHRAYRNNSVAKRGLCAENWGTPICCRVRDSTNDASNVLIHNFFDTKNSLKHIRVHLLENSKRAPCSWYESALNSIDEKAENMLSHSKELVHTDYWRSSAAMKDQNSTAEEISGCWNLLVDKVKRKICESLVDFALSILPSADPVYRYVGGISGRSVGEDTHPARRHWLEGNLLAKTTDVIPEVVRPIFCSADTAENVKDLEYLNVLQTVVLRYWSSPAVLKHNSGTANVAAAESDTEHDRRVAAGKLTSLEHERIGDALPEDLHCEFEKSYGYNHSLSKLAHLLFTESDVREANHNSVEVGSLFQLFHTTVDDPPTLPKEASLNADAKYLVSENDVEIRDRPSVAWCNNWPFQSKTTECFPLMQEVVSNKSKEMHRDNVHEVTARLASAGVWFPGEGTAHNVKSDDKLESIFESFSSVHSPHFAPARQDIFCYTVPRYPDNHNPLLPLALQKKLDLLSPREFLSYVLNDLTLEERESLMVDEKQRRKTFQISWPHGDNLSGVKMAQAGFYCVDDFDRVQCVFCRGCLHRWEPDDVPMSEHSRSFNFCRFVKGLECGNREFKDQALSTEELANVTFFIKPEYKKGRDGSVVAADSSSFGFSTNKADTIQYAPGASRLRTFSRWPANSPIPSRKLCDAGFYYTGFNDQVRCFYCSGGIGEWKVSDDPFEEHARWFPECDYLIQQKGLLWIDQVHDRTPPNKKCRRATVLQKAVEVEEKQRQSDQQVMVGICMSLGHEKWIIDAALKRNGGPFGKVGEMIESIYQMEEADDFGESGRDQVDGAKTMVKTDMTESGYYSIDSINNSFSLKSTDKLMSAIPDEDREKYAQIESDALIPGAMDEGKYRPPPTGCCRVCYRKTGQTVTGSQIGLPCGHMIFCDKCNAEEQGKAGKDPTYKPKCPYLRCGASLAGSLKVYVT